MGIWKKPDAKVPPKVPERQPEKAVVAPPNGARTAVPPALPPKPSAPIPPSPENVAPQTQPELSSERLRQIATAAKGMSATFGEIVSLLAKTEPYRNFTLADLEWLVVPALLAGQFSVANAQSKTQGMTAPVGVVLWAKVSEEVDKRLSADPQQPAKLDPREWASGDILWAVIVAGDSRVIQGILQQLHDKQWDKRPAKIVVRDKAGKSAIATIEAKAA